MYSGVPQLSFGFGPRPSFFGAQALSLIDASLRIDRIGFRVLGAASFCSPGSVLITLQPICTGLLEDSTT